MLQQQREVQNLQKQVAEERAGAATFKQQALQKQSVVERLDAQLAANVAVQGRLQDQLGQQQALMKTLQVGKARERCRLWHFLDATMLGTLTMAA